MLQVSLGPVGSLLAAASQVTGVVPQHPGPTHWHNCCLTALLPVPCHASGYESWDLGDTSVTLHFWSRPREHLAGQKPCTVIWNPCTQGPFLSIGQSWVGDVRGFQA